jgi:hypothetical protein
MKKPTRYTGPYLFKSGRCAGRKFMVVYYSDGSRGTTLYSRYLMQEHLGRRLGTWEDVDHINEDKTDDVVTNFQLLSKGEHASKTAKIRFKDAWLEFNCPICGIASRRIMSQVRRSKKRGNAGPFCGKVCSRKYQVSNARMAES